jgi:mono/diheme cytochrome c family protein
MGAPAFLDHCTKFLRSSSNSRLSRPCVINFPAVSLSPKTQGGFTILQKETLFIVATVMLFSVSMLSGHPKSSTASVGKIARGKYLVENTSMCHDCHTPRNEKGELIKEQSLKGMALPFKPAVPMPVWADKSVNIAGLPGWEKDAAIKFFMTGIAYNGLPARPPMPQYRFNQQDAEAIVAYLQSLK